MFNAIILGLIQGLTEFLPVSSSGHVLFFEEVLNFTDEPGFAAAIHLATAIAAIIYFRKDIFKILKAFLHWKSTSEEDFQAKDLGLKVIVATIPAAILGIIVTKLNLDSYFSNAMAIGVASIVFGILLYFADRKSQKLERALPAHREFKQSDYMTYKNAFLIGASQIIAAIIPGASRSGVTLTSSFFLKTKKEYAAKFVFLISIPITLMASLNEIVLQQSVTINTEFVLAFVAAFLSGLAAIYILLKLINTNSLKWLCLYRIAFGTILVIYAITR